MAGFFEKFSKKFSEEPSFAEEYKEVEIKPSFSEEYKEKVTSKPSFSEEYSVEPQKEPSFAEAYNEELQSKPDFSKENDVEVRGETDFEKEYKREFREDNGKEDLHIDKMDKTNKGRVFEANANGRVVLCGANAYELKYYFNPLFRQIPESIKKELNIISVLFTQEAGGIFTILFEEDGTISIETNADEEDITYDEITAGLLVGEVRRKRQDLFEALGLYYRIYVLHEDPAELLGEDD